MKLDYQKFPLIFNAYKPVGVSSFSVVHHFKKNLNYDFGKIGHFGTLDPFAEGVLMIGVQGAQRLNEYIHELLPKTYLATGIFGQKTTSGDHTGEIAQNQEINREFQIKSKEELENFLKEKFMGEYWQSPHSISATKFEGKRLYEHALSGRIITKDKVKREILDLTIVSYNYPELVFSVTVSSGTYVRSLFEEIAVITGGVGHLKNLKRTAIGENLSSASLTKEQWPVKENSFDLEKWGTPLDKALRLNRLILSQEQTAKYLQGQRMKVSEVECLLMSTDLPVASSLLFWVYNPDGHLLGLSKLEEGQYMAIFNLRLAILQLL
ncbi:MAG: hypothetical protein HOP07_03170 [Bacteriovoracaceae bacterium]|nr:hypothetical protein [Bacteriovoracaceae bacterium]